MTPRTVNKQKRCVLNFEEGIEVCQLRGDRVASAMDWIVSPKVIYGNPTPGLMEFEFGAFGER